MGVEVGHDLAVEVGVAVNGRWTLGGRLSALLAGFGEGVAAWWTVTPETLDRFGPERAAR